MPNIDSKLEICVLLTKLFASKESNSFNPSLIRLISHILDSISAPDWEEFLDNWIAILRKEMNINFQSTRLFLHIYSANPRVLEFRQRFALKLLDASDLTSALASVKDLWSVWSNNYIYLFHMLSIVQVLINSRLTSEKVHIPLSLEMRPRMDCYIDKILSENKRTRGYRLF
jgi:hypothetical protein